MNVIRVELPSFDRIELIPLSDMHLGDPLTDEVAIENTIKYILEQPNRFVVINGDITNTALKASKSDIYSAKYSIEEENNVAYRLLKPLADDNRILGMTPGNHEARIYNETGIDVGLWLAQRLGILERYSKTSYILFIRFGKSASWTPTRNKKNVYSCFIRHGSSGGRSAGSKLNKAMEMSDIVDCDINITSHVHDAILKPSIRLKVDIQNQTVSEQKVDYIVTNAFQAFGGYGLQLGFTPSIISVSYIIMNGNGAKRTILVNGLIDESWNQHAQGATHGKQ